MLSQPSARGGGGIRACTVPAVAVPPEPPEPAQPRRRRPWTPTLRDVVDEAQRFALTLAARRHQGNMTQAAKAVGVSRRTLRAAAKRLGLYQAFVEQGVNRRLAGPAGGA